MIHVACAADENYAPHCAAMLHSVLTEHPPQDVTVHFLHGPRLEADILDKLKQLVEGAGSTINFIQIPDEAVHGLQKRGDVAGVMWYRLFLPERLPDLERVLYIDADTLVVDSLQPLWDTDLGDHYAAAVRNDFEPAFTHRPLELGLRSDADYFNSGVLLMNLAVMRHEHMRARVIDAVRERGETFMWQDQDPLNVVFDGRWVRVHPRWNCQSSLFYFSHANDVFGAEIVREACESPAVVHFEGPDPMKPWHFLNKHPYRRRYLAHRAQTPWPTVRFEGQTLKNRLLRPLPSLAIFALLRAEYMLRSRLAGLGDRMRRGVLRRAMAAVRAALSRLGYRIDRIPPKDQAIKRGYDDSAPLPADATTDLRPDHPRLLELQRRYRAFDSPITRDQRPSRSGIDERGLCYFRGEPLDRKRCRELDERPHAYDRMRLKYYIYARYIRALDHRGLLGRTLTEDGAFGCFAFRFEDMPTVSRDLLDSINELYFLDRHWDLFQRSGVRVLEIGAGYGRFAHRMLTAVQGVERYSCIAAIPHWTFLSEHYLRYRGLLGQPDSRANVVPLDEMASAVPRGSVDLAINIHSFSEMSYTAIEGWVGWLDSLEAPWLFVRTDGPEMVSDEHDGTHRAYLSLLDRAGYQVAVREPTVDADTKDLAGMGDDSFFLLQRG